MNSIVKEICIYPIKSLAGISVKEAKAKPAGFEYDRRWMLIDENNKFLTQRSIKEMALFKPTLLPDHLSISYKGEEISFGLEDNNNKTYHTQVFDDQAIGIGVSEEVSTWFSEKMNQPVTLIKLKDDQSRNHHNSTRNIDIPVSFADGYPYLLTGTESLTLLKSKLDFEINMNRFRPNIVASTLLAHEEDDWNKVKIGSIEFLNLKPCGRCNIITINQENTEVNNQVLKVLNTYRKQGNSVLFGTNMMCLEEGIIKVGDEIRLI